MSRFITYGDLPLECHLEFIEDHALKYFKKISIDNEVPEEKRWDKPVSSFLNFLLSFILRRKKYLIPGNF